MLQLQLLQWTCTWSPPAQMDTVTFLPFSILLENLGWMLLCVWYTSEPSMHLQQMLLPQLFHSIFFIAYGKFSALSFKNCIFLTFPFNISVRGSAAVLLTAGKVGFLYHQWHCDKNQSINANKVSFHHFLCNLLHHTVTRAASNYFLPHQRYKKP